MNQRIYTVYDLKAGAYLAPFFMRADGEAMRAFADAVNDPKTDFHRHAEDYILYCVGEYDDTKGLVMPLERHELLGKAVEFLRGRQLDLEDPFVAKAMKAPANGLYDETEVL